MSTESLNSEAFRSYPFVEIIAISVIEFLIPGSVYSFGIFYSEICRTEKCDDVLWLPFSLFVSWFIADTLSCYLRKYWHCREKLAITILILVILLAKIISLAIKNYTAKFALQGCLEGFCTSVILAILKLCRDVYFDANPRSFLLVRLLARAFALLMTPLLYQLLIYSYGVKGAQFVYAAVVLHAIPAALVIFRKPSIEVAEHIVLKNVIYSDDYNDAFWEKRTDCEEDEVAVPKPMVNARGVEIMPVIEEERESVSTYMNSVFGLNNLRKSKTWLDLNDEDELDRKWRLAWICNESTARMCLLVFTRSSLMFSFVVYLMLLPKISFGEAVLSLMGSMWILFLLMFSFIISTRIKRIIMFLLGLGIIALSSYLLQTKRSIDVVTSSALMFGFGYGAVSYVEEKMMEEYVIDDGKAFPNVLTGIIVIVIFACVQTLNLWDYIFFSITTAIIVNFFIWCCVPVIRKVWDLKSKQSFEVA